MKTWNNLLAGVAGGVLGAWVMLQFRARWDTRAGAGWRSGIFGFDEEADLNSVDTLYHWAGLPAAPKDHALRAAMWLHYGYAVLAGAAYGCGAAWTLKVTAGFGTAFGTVLWLAGDELPISAARLSNPFERDLSSHTSAWFAHVLFGLSVEAVRRTLIGRMAAIR